MAAKRKKILVLIDAHAVLHRSFHALPNLSSPDGKPTGALYGFTTILLKIIREFNPDFLAACYDLPKPTFRHLFYEKYKAKRPEMATELIPQINDSKKILKAFGVPIFESSGFEADDLLATIVEQLKRRQNLKIIIVTGDLDTLQLVSDEKVVVYTMKKGVQETILYNEKAVKKRFGFDPKLLPDFKGLMGDPSDNIPGAPGIGEKTAKLLIQKFGSLEDIYKRLKKDKGDFFKKGLTRRIIKILEDHQEEIYFSKILAEARKDAPISVSLDDLSWQGHFKEVEVKELFRQFGFRSLLARLSFNKDEKERNLGKNNNDSDNRLEQELKIAFWLLDSRRINPSLGDIFFYTKTRSLIEAKEKLESEIKEKGLEKLYYEIELPLIDVLKKMENRGVLLDIDYLKKLLKIYQEQLDRIEKRIWQMAGEKFNINSPKQLSEVLFTKIKIHSKGVRRTSQGSFSTRFSELFKIKDRHPIIEKIFEYREFSKLISTYIKPLPLLVDKEKRLHTIFNQTGTLTGRLSSANPNLQNIPARSEIGRAIRRAFTAPLGFSLVSFDYSQIELRIAAFLSGDKKLNEAFLKGDDIHSRVAAEVFNIPLEKVDRAMRRRAKVINFGIIYGMGINNLRKSLGCSKEEAEKFYRDYFENFSGMKFYLEKIKSEAKEKGFTTTLFGRRRYLPEINSSVDFIRKEAERMAVNAPIQGTAADIIKLAMVKIDDYLVKNGLEEDVRLILQVHDELLFEIRNDIIDKMIHLLKDLMEDRRLMKVFLKVDVFRGLNWMEMDKVL